MSQNAFSHGKSKVRCAREGGQLSLVLSMASGDLDSCASSTDYPCLCQSTVYSSSVLVSRPTKGWMIQLIRAIELLDGELYSN